MPPTGNTCTSRAITEFAFSTSVSTVEKLAASIAATTFPKVPPVASVVSISATVTVSSTSRFPATAAVCSVQPLPPYNHIFCAVGFSAVPVLNQA